MKDTVAIVTGGTSGIGRAVALCLAQGAADVVVVGRDVARMDETLAALRDEQAKCPAAGRVMGLRLDVRSPDDMDAMARQAIALFGRIDVLIAAAGTGGSLAKSRGLPYTLAQMPVEEWDEIIDTNLKGVCFSNRSVLPFMMKQRKGSIVNVASYPGAVRGIAGAAAYCASKHGVLGLSKALLEETGRYGVRVQVVLPGVTETPMLYGAGGVAALGALDPRTVAEHIVRMLTLPVDAALIDSTVIPWGGGDGRFGARRHGGEH